MIPEVSAFDSVVSGIDSPMQYGRVVRCEQKEIVVAFGNEPSSGRVAFSCLVMPHPGDYVLCANGPRGFYVLAVLEREDSQNMTMSFPADATIAAGSGSINLVAGNTLGITSAHKVSMVSETYTVKSSQTFADLETVTVRGKDLNAAIESVRLIGQTVTTLAAQLFQKVRDYVRHSESSDNVKAAHMNRKVGGLYSLDSTHTIMVSRKDTKIDGERIHMG